VYLAVAVATAGMLLALGSGLASGYVQFALLCAAATLTGAAANLGLLTVQRTAGQAARDATERVRIFSWLGVAPSFANVLGPVAVGLMIDAQGFSAGYAMLLLLPLLSLLPARLVPRLQPPAAARALPGTPGHTGSAWNLLRVPGMKRLLAVNWLLSMCWDVHAFAVPILGHERGFSASTIGLVLGTFTLSVTLLRLLLPLIARQLQASWVLPAAMVGTAIVFALYPLATTPLAMAACAAVLGLTLGTVQPVMLNTLHHLTPGQRHGEALAFRSMAINASSTLMPLLFGASGAVLGAAVLFWTVGAAVGAGAWPARRVVAPAAPCP
jgi:MFS family permease